MEFCSSIRETQYFWPLGTESGVLRSFPFIATRHFILVAIFVYFVDLLQTTN